ncbi:hypothetical protein BDV96DRAFT_640228 [Lophiotrema nucula]|uniref:Uncharacterized protein n=1 Tax=Lophiotrema nucula TaxID=690887 RepID=A0A6A5ZT43_9PLEO|nr:hypothetical protein BDV96DRAFT_640228 [Lophiotrema nucula]
MSENTSLKPSLSFARMPEARMYGDADVAMTEAPPSRSTTGEVDEKNTKGRGDAKSDPNRSSNAPPLKAVASPDKVATESEGSTKLKTANGGSQLVLPYRTTLQVPFGSKRYLGSSPSKYAISRVGRDNATVFPSRGRGNNIQPPRIKLLKTLAQRNAMDFLSVRGPDRERDSTVEVSSISSIDHNPTTEHMFGQPLRSRSMTPFELLHHQNELQATQNAQLINSHELLSQRDVVAELTVQNENIYKCLGALCERLDRVEAENKELHAKLAAHQPYSTDSDDNDSGTDEEEMFVPTTPRKKTALLPTPESPGGFKSDNTAMVLPTPKTNTPRSRLLLTRRAAHNLSKQMAHQKTQFPAIPLTDVEVVVFFYNSVARPVVAARLYGRDFGPKNIADALNNHRDLDPPYLRNSATVKCINALKRGAEHYGAEWEDNMKRVFATASTSKATRMCYITPEEGESYDCDILDLAVGIKDYPEVGASGGIFTQCVKFCADRQLNYPLSQIATIAHAVRGEDTPEPIHVSTSDLPTTPRTPKKAKPCKLIARKNVEHNNTVEKDEEGVEDE